MRHAARSIASVTSGCAHAAASIALVACMLATPDIGIAQPGDRDRVVFVLHEQSPAVGVLHAFDSMRGQLGELELDISAVHVPRLDAVSKQARRTAQIAEQQRATAAFWFERRTGDSLRVYALHVPSGRVFARDVALAHDATVQREQLAVVLRAAIPAVLEGGDDLGEPLLVVPPEPTVRPSRPLPPPSPAPEIVADGGEDEPVQLRTAVGYAGSAVAPEASWQNGVSWELLLDAGGWLRVSLGAGYATPTTIEGSGADAIVTRIPIVARLGMAQSIGRVGIGLEVGPLFEGWHRRTVVRTDALEATASTMRWRLGGQLLGRFEFRVDGRLGLYVLAGGDWLPAPHDFAIRSAQSEQELTTYAVCPHVGLGATFDLLPSRRIGDGAKDSTSPEATRH